MTNSTEIETSQTESWYDSAKTEVQAQTDAAQAYVKETAVEIEAVVSENIEAIADYAEDAYESTLATANTIEQAWESATDSEVAREQAQTLNEDPGWLEALPDCPCTETEAEQSQDFEPAGWGDRQLLEVFHPGAESAFRSAEPTEYETPQGETLHLGQQCTYDERGQLITDGPGAGTPDLVAPEHSALEHFAADVAPWLALETEEYNETWVPNNGNNCPENPLEFESSDLQGQEMLSLEQLQEDQSELDAYLEFDNSNSLESFAEPVFSPMPESSTSSLESHTNQGGSESTHESNSESTTDLF
jgi:hypothetical protein